MTLMMPRGVTLWPASWPFVCASGHGADIRIPDPDHVPTTGIPLPDCSCCSAR